ncbi:hypothetical protein H8N01_00105, partial [Streptomyces sp. AC536]|uniref:hypothetical protein n=1 Tax=Streptomyces buecherae TaxID=2763006 RepID=UPI00164CF5F5
MLREVGWFPGLLLVKRLVLALPLGGGLVLALCLRPLGELVPGSLAHDWRVLVRVLSLVWRLVLLLRLLLAWRLLLGERLVLGVLG